MDSDRLAYTFDEAGAVMGVSGHTIRRLVADGDLPLIKIRGARRIPRAALEQYVSANTIWRARSPTGTAKRSVSARSTPTPNAAEELARYLGIEPIRRKP